MTNLSPQMNRNRLATLAGPVLLLLLLTAVALIARPLTPIDETRYVSVAWEMWQKGEFIVPFKNGEAYSHKPPLLFWLYQLGWAIFGVNGWWPRLVSPLFSLGGLLLTYSIARRLWLDDAATAGDAQWVLSACALWMVFSTAAMFDVMLAFFVLLGMRGLLIAATESSSRGMVWLAVSIGLGVLAKGPVVLLHLLPAALLAPWWQGKHGGFAWRRWYSGVGLALLGGAAIALAWAIPAAIRGGEEYRAAIFWGQTAQRMVDSFAHKRPIWWYLPWLPLLLFPWLFWPALWRRLYSLRREGLDRGLRFCLAWSLPVLIMLSFISGKQFHYLVPLLPAFALVAARVLTGGGGGGIWFPALWVALLAAAMLYVSYAGLPELDADIGLPVWPGLLLLVAISLAVWAGREEKRRVPALAWLSASAFAAVQLCLAPLILRIYDVQPIAQAIKSLQERGVPVAHLGKYHAQFQFAGRLEKPLVQLDEADLPAWLDENPQGVVLAYFEPRQKLPHALFSHAYRGGIAVLIDAESARTMPGFVAPRKRSSP